MGSMLASVQGELNTGKILKMGVEVAVGVDRGLFELSFVPTEPSLTCTHYSRTELPQSTLCYESVRCHFEVTVLREEGSH